MREIRARVLAAKEGSVFVASDFSDIADSASIRQGLQRLHRTGILRRILRGVYEKQISGEPSDNCAAANPDAVAYALARKYCWSITPCSDLPPTNSNCSSQEITVKSYLSSGPHKTFVWDSIKLEFEEISKSMMGAHYVRDLMSDHAHTPMRKMRARILSAESGTVFVSSDFADIADTATIHQGLQRLYRSGTIRRILRGVYEKPKYSNLLCEYVAPDPNTVARALARNYHWSIAPCGNTALNLLGLSTQVPAVWSYTSDGPYKTYAWSSAKLEFKHRTNREITGLSYMTILVIQALKTLKKSNVTPDIIQTLSEKLSEDEKQSCLKEAGAATDWIYDTIRKICEGNTS